MDAATSAGVDAYVTADLRHHPAAEHLLAGTVAGRTTPALVDVAHWASEHPWCEQAAEVIRVGLGGTVDVRVSQLRTDPWTISATSADADDIPGRTAQ
ncbi:MAG: Nif3-like dinuclear metal center hexameric protein [Pseudonocardiales bacterium]|nr:Nif3-like dinuclear metal center hexameric protein [Pseudonocardiales bacterium]